jgi:hypothetical protein
MASLSPKSETILLLLLLLAYAQGQGPSQGIVKGVLITYDGRLASEYAVDIIGTSTSSTRRMTVQTDQDGAFTFGGLKVGKYVIAPFIEGAYGRYLRGTSSFYNRDPVRIQLTDSEPSKQITIHLGPPNRILSGKVLSSLDGSPVTAVIQIEYPGDPDRFIRFSSTMSGAFRVLIPAKTQLAMKTTAPGYATESQLLGPIAEDIDPQVDVKLKPAGRP